MSAIARWLLDLPPAVQIPAVLTVAGFGGKLIAFLLAEFRFRERVKIKVNFRYRLSLPRDTTRYPWLDRHAEPKNGERCLLIRVRYQGRHSLKIQNLLYELAIQDVHHFTGFPQRELQHGQSAEYIFLERGGAAFEHYTAIIVEAPDGRRTVQNVHRLRRFQLLNLTRRYGLFRFVQELIGFPPEPTKPDFDPVVCPNCGAGRHLFKTIQEEDLHVTSLIPGHKVFRKRRSFLCPECSNQWTATGLITEPDQDSKT